MTSSVSRAIKIGEAGYSARPSVTGPPSARQAGIHARSSPPPVRRHRNRLIEDDLSQILFRLTLLQVPCLPGLTSLRIVNGGSRLPGSADVREPGPA